MALKGTLRDFSLPDIFQLIGIQRKTGILTLKRDKEVVTVSFVDGSVVGAESLHRQSEDRLGTVLVKTGQITEARLREALKIQQETLNRLGNVLVEHKMIDMSALREALQIQISQTVYRLFRWTSGEFNFSQEGQVDYEKKYVVPIQAETILMEGARIIDEWPMIEKGIGSFSTVYRHADVEIAQPGSGAKVNDEGSSPEGAVSLNKEERIVHALIDGKRSVQEIVERSLFGEFETCRILFELINRQLVEAVLTRRPKQTEAVQAPKPRPFSPVLQGLAYLILILVAGGAVVLRTGPWLTQLAQGGRFEANLSPLFRAAEITSLEGALDQDRLLKVDFAIQVYYLLNRSYPPDLEQLVISALLRSSDIIDSAGGRYGYETNGQKYLLSSDERR